MTRKNPIVSLWTAICLFCCSLPNFAQTTLWQHSVDRFSESTSIDLTQYDSILFKKNSMRLYYKKELGKVLDYVTRSYPSAKNYDYFTFENPGRIIYKPNEFASMDFYSESSKWCFQRSKESEHFIIFWQEGFGLNPEKSSIQFNPDNLLERAERYFAFYADSLGFVYPGNSRSTDKYKIEIFVNYQSDWLATGSGYDDTIGALWCNPTAVNDGPTAAHEIGHSFQYLVSCDLGTTHGWRYGFGTNASGGCAWWENCAQWQAYKFYPGEQFTSYHYSGYLTDSYMSILNERWRYENYFIMDYWCQLHGMKCIGTLWRESVKPEDPVEAYKRIYNVTQSEFNDEFFDFARRCASWDIDGIRELGKNYIDGHSSYLTQDASDKSLWVCDVAHCPENYGYNIHRVNNAPAGTVIKANFKGLAGDSRWRNLKTQYAGWRYGFCALKQDGQRVYGDIFSDKEGVAEFVVPEDVEKIWFVVSGAPTQHWRHPWDSDDDTATANDEQWPYQVKFENTNKYGYYDDYPADYQRKDSTVTIECELPYSSSSYSSVQVQYDMGAVSEALGLSTAQMKKLGYSSSSNPGFAGVNANGSLSYTMTSTSSASYFGHWFNISGNVCGYDSNARIYAEITRDTYKVNVGQYPGKLTKGKTYTIRQAIRYKPTGGTKYYTVTFIVKVKVV